MRVNFLGHGSFLLEHEGHRLVIDPFLSGNEQAPLKPSEVEVEAILLTHGHGDHFGDTIEIGKRTGATVVAPFELAGYCESKGLKVHPMHIGGSHTFPFGWVKLTPAWHGSAVEEGGQVIYTGNPCGFLVEMGGKTLYCAGDTGLFGDMGLIGSRHSIDVALLPIGDNFTMGPDDAVYAAELVKAPVVVPMHYNTWELISQDADAFARRVRGSGQECVVLKPGESLEA